MPAWLIPIVINLVLKVGMPIALDWLHKRLPWFPLSDAFMAALKEHVDAVAEQKVVTKAKLQKVCTGAICPTDLVRE